MTERLDPAATDQRQRELMTELFTPRLTELQREQPSVIAAQVCTSDGFVVAQAHSNAEAGRRLAAMVSSLHAVGAAMVEDLQLGTYGHLSVEASLGKCMLFALPGAEGRLLLAAIADGDMLWGQFMTACRSLSETLGKLAPPAN
jgi:predicted regulator of Ras-like GTPase activity (Roadblock/LC7/MglB family)